MVIVDGTGIKAGVGARGEKQDSRIQGVEDSSEKSKTDKPQSKRPSP